MNLHASGFQITTKTEPVLHDVDEALRSFLRALASFLAKSDKLDAQEPESGHVALDVDANLAVTTAAVADALIGVPVALTTTGTARAVDVNGVRHAGTTSGRASDQQESVYFRSMLKPGNYRHFKGTVYRVILIAKNSETEEPMAVYHKMPYVALRDENGIPKSVLESPEWWARPVSMFEESVTWPDGVVRPRFVPVEGPPVEDHD